MVLFLGPTDHTNSIQVRKHLTTQVMFPDSLVLVTVGDTPPQGRVAVAETSNTVGVIRAPASAGLIALPIAHHTSSIYRNGNGKEIQYTAKHATCLVAMAIATCMH